MSGNGVFNPSRERTFLSTNDLSAKQFCGVSLDASNDNSIVASNAQTLPPIGILQNAPIATDTARVVLFGPTTFVAAGGTIAKGDKLTTNASGLFITTTTPADVVYGTALEAAVNGDRIEMMISGGHYYHA